MSLDLGDYLVKGRRVGMLSDGAVDVIGDATEEETLKEAGIKKAKVLLALLPSDADNLYLSIAAKEVKSGVVDHAAG